jgi:hypothetical protein
MPLNLFYTCIGLCCQRKLRSAERRLSADQNFGDLDGVQGSALLAIISMFTLANTLDH